MLNKSVAIFCLCCILTIAFSISVNAAPPDDKTSVTPVTMEKPSSNGNTSVESGTSDISPDTSDEASTEITEKFLKDNISTGLALNRPALIKNQTDGSLVLTGKKWVAKNILNGGKITLSEARPVQNVYIYGCQDTTFIIPNTLTHIAHLELQKCENVTVRFPSVVSSIEISDCKNMTINCFNNISTIQLDKTDGCRIYMPSEVADRCIFTHSQCKSLTLHPILKINGKPESKPLPIPDSIMMSKGQDQSIEEKIKTKKIPEQYLTRMEKDPGGIYKTDEKGKLIKNPKGELSVIKQYSKNSHGELLSIKRCLRDQSGQYLVFRKTMELILEENCEWIWIKRFRRDENNRLIDDPNGDWIQITRNTNQLKDDQGYLILPENNKFPTLDELIHYHMNRLNQLMLPATETNG